MLRFPFSVRCPRRRFADSSRQRRRFLLIEPLESRRLLAQIDYATFLGDSGDDLEPASVAVDAEGCSYVAGHTNSSNFYGSTNSGFADVYVAKLATSQSCTSPTWSTLIGGSGQDGTLSQLGLAIDASGDVLLAGYTGSSDFPTTDHTSVAAEGMFVTKLRYDDVQGNVDIEYSTVIADTWARDITLDSSGNIYVAGSSWNPTLSTTSTPLGARDSFVAKYSEVDATDPDYPLSLVWGTFVGGSIKDTGYGFAIHESAGQVSTYITGRTESSDFLTARSIPHSNAVATELKGESDAFLVKLDHNGTPVYGTYIGGDEGRRGGSEQAHAVSVDLTGAAWITGKLTSTDFAGTPGAHQENSQGSNEAFAAKINPNASPSSLEYFTYLGGAKDDWGRDIGLDGAHVYVTGHTSSTDFPVVEPLPNSGLDELQGKQDGFLIKLDPTAANPQDQLVFSTFLGGSKDDQSMSLTLDSGGSVYLGGRTSSSDFPDTGAAAFDDSFAGGNRPDATLTKISFPGRTPGITVSPTSGLQTDEGGGDASVTVVLDTQPTADVTIGISSSDTSEGVPDVSNLTFTSSNWSTPQTVTVTGVDDDDQDGDIAYTIVTAPATSADPAYNGIDPPDVAVSNTDNEVAPTVNDYAIAELALDGTASGSFVDTMASDDVYQTITEELYAGNKRSRLEHQWEFDVTGGSSVTFFVEAHHNSSAENFVFEYSLDAVTWITMLTVTSEEDLLQSFALPSSTSGTVFVRVSDSDRSRSENSMDAIFIDEMFFRSES